MLLLAVLTTWCCCLFGVVVPEQPPLVWPRVTAQRHQEWPRSLLRRRRLLASLLRLLLLLLPVLRPHSVVSVSIRLLLARRGRLVHGCCYQLTHDGLGKHPDLCLCAACAAGPASLLPLLLAAGCLLASRRGGLLLLLWLLWRRLLRLLLWQLWGRLRRLLWLLCLRQRRLLCRFLLLLLLSKLRLEWLQLHQLLVNKRPDARQVGCELCNGGGTAIALLLLLLLLLWCVAAGCLRGR
jgi:hypothetical protein